MADLQRRAHDDRNLLQLDLLAEQAAAPSEASQVRRARSSSRPSASTGHASARSRLAANAAPQLYRTPWRSHDLHAGLESQAIPPAALGNIPSGSSVLLTVDQVVHQLHIGRRQTWELIWRGELPIVRLGPRTIRVHHAALDQFLLERSKPYGA